MAAATADPTTGIMNLTAFVVASSEKSFSKQTAGFKTIFFIFHNFDM